MFGVLLYFQAKEFVKDPSKFAAVATAAAPAAAEAAVSKPAETKKVEEPEESEDEDMGFGLFD